MGEDGADKGVEDGRRVTASCDGGRRDGSSWAVPRTVEGGENAASEFAFLWSWMREVGKG